MIRFKKILRWYHLVKPTKILNFKIKFTIKQRQAMRRYTAVAARIIHRPWVVSMKPRQEIISHTMKQQSLGSPWRMMTSVQLHEEEQRLLNSVNKLNLKTLQNLMVSNSHMSNYCNKTKNWIFHQASHPRHQQKHQLESQIDQINKNL